MPSFSKWVELAGSDKPVAPGAEIPEAIPPEKSFDLSLIVRRRKALPPLSSRHHKPMTRAEYARNHGADPADLRKVRAFAEHFHLRVAEVLPAERTIILVGPAAAFATAFHVKLRKHRFPDGSSHQVREGCISIPTELSGIVVGVFGLDNRPVVSRPVRFKPTPETGIAAADQFQNPGPFRAFFPNQLAKIYHFPEGTDGKGQTIGIVDLGGGFRRQDLAAYFQRVGVKNPPTIWVAKGHGLAKNASGHRSNPQHSDPPDVEVIEVLLDMEIIGTVAPGAKMVMYFAKDGSDQHCLRGVSAAVHDSSADLSILSLSWGVPEFDGESGGGRAHKQFQENLNDVLKAAAHLGITVCVASGDTASAGMPNDPNQWDGNAHVNFPASSPFVLACGGTHLIDPSDANLREEAWHPEPHVGTGGGISRYFPLPSYQRGIVKQSAVNPRGGTGRGVPDVAANAAKESGYRVLVDNQWYPDPAARRPPAWGTSAAAPLWAGLIALLNQSLNTRLGFVNPFLYKLTASSGAFHDVTLGDNGDYRCRRGWDACTGLGTPNGQNLLKALSKAVKVRAATRTGKAHKKGPWELVSGKSPVERGCGGRTF